MSDIIERRPFTPLSRIRSELDRLFGNGFPDIWGEENGARMWTPRLDFSETENEYLTKLDLPGIKKDDVKVKVENQQLTISGERKEEKRNEDENYLRVERSHGSFYRSMPLPNNARTDEIQAEIKNGVLMVHIPKSKEEKAKTIKVK